MNYLITKTDNVKRTRKHATLLSMILIMGLTMIAGCEGPTGPEGPEGPQGSEGQQGPQGPQGREGTANVLYSDWITVERDDWQIGGSSGNKYAFYDIPSSPITQNIIDQGGIMVYVDLRNFGFINSIYSLPATSEFPSFSFTFYHKIQLENLQVGFFNPDDRTTDPGLGESVKYRYVIIPGGKSANAKAKSNKKPVNWEKYQEVKKYYDLPDQGASRVLESK